MDGAKTIGGVVEDGYEFFARRRLVTLFSTPNYCGEFDNAGGLISVDENLMCSIMRSGEICCETAIFCYDEFGNCVHCSGGNSASDNNMNVPIPMPENGSNATTTDSGSGSKLSNNF
eukprot:scaffold3813_cov146-Chaetoceros_neogracile.AAC.1